MYSHVHISLIETKYDFDVENMNWTVNMSFVGKKQTKMENENNKKKTLFTLKTWWTAHAIFRSNYNLHVVFWDVFFWAKIHSAPGSHIRVQC